jgi:phosphoinositide-3-kinase regulatory subunit 4
LRASISGEPSSTPRAQEKSKDAPSLEDLRSKLATIGGSSTSLNSTFSQHERRDSPNAIPARSPTFDRSPPESVTSGDLGSHRRRQRLQLSTDSKAPPSVGSIRTNAIGLVEAPAALRAVHEDMGTSGRSSPVSQAGTLRGERRPPIIRAVSGAGGKLWTTRFSKRQLIVLPDDPSVYNLLEHMNLESGKEGMQDFGPRVSETPARRRANVRTPLQSRENGSGKGDVLLVANLTAHAGPVNSLIVSPDHLFFVSGSDDKTVKIWDTARLERNVTSKPRHTYAQHHARVTALCIIERTHCFASAADDGSLHVVRVHVSQSGSLPKYNKTSIIREHRIDHPGEYITCLAHYHSGGFLLLIFWGPLILD